MTISKSEAKLRIDTLLRRSDFELDSARRISIGMNLADIIDDIEPDKESAKKQTALERLDRFLAERFQHPHYEAEATQAGHIISAALEAVAECFKAFSVDGNSTEFLSDEKSEFYRRLRAGRAGR